MDSSRIFAIVIAYNGMQWYERCLRSLLDSDIDVRIIVVDNASTDGTVDYIRTNFPEVILIEAGLNLGFGKANNLALKHVVRTGFDYVFLLNQDAWVETGTIRKLVEIQQKHPEYGIVSPMHARKDRLSLYMQILDGNENNPNKELISDLYCGTVKDIYKERYVNAAAWLMSRSTIDVIGGFDPIFNHYEEDVDYLNRAAFHNVLVGICPSVSIIHDHQTAPSGCQSEKAIRKRREQALTVDLINPSNSISLLSYELKMLKKGVLSVARGKFGTARVCFIDFIFIFLNRGRIKLSRKVNRIAQPSWLVDM